MPFLFCGGSTAQVLFIIFSATSIMSSGLLLWTHYYKISLMITDKNRSWTIRMTGVIGGICIGLIGSLFVLLSTINHYNNMNPSESLLLYFSNTTSIIPILIMERCAFVLSISLNCGSESYIIYLLRTKNQKLDNGAYIFIIILLIGIISDFIGIIGSIIYISTLNLTPTEPILLVLSNWIRFSPTINIWSQSHSSDLYKILVKVDSKNIMQFSSSNTLSNQILKSKVQV